MKTITNIDQDAFYTFLVEAEGEVVEVDGGIQMIFLEDGRVVHNSPLSGAVVIG